MAEAARGSSLVALIEVMGRLRVQCDWKAAQTHRSLARHLLEETYETLEAIETGDADHLREELGDLLLQIYFHAAIAEQHGEFDIDDVASDLIGKLVRRNPHVFGDDSIRGTVSGPTSVNELWESMKALEKQRESVLDGIPPELPALLYADKVLDRLARSGLETGASAPSSTPGPVVEEVAQQPSAVVEEVAQQPSAVVEEVAQQPSGVVEEVAQQPSRNHANDVLGDRLLALVAECRAEGVDPEQALRDAVRRLH